MNAGEIKPPFLLTPAHYTNWMPFIAVTDERRLEVRCKATPVKGIAIVTGVIALFCAGFYWLLAVKAPESAWAAVLIGLLTVIGTPVAIVLYHRHEQEAGPVLIYQKADKTLELPRSRKRFKLEDVDSLAVIDAHTAGGDWVCQLQLLARTGERILLVPSQTRRELRPILQEIQRQIDLPLRFFKLESGSKKSLADETAAGLNELMVSKTAAASTRS